MAGSLPKQQPELLQTAQVTVAGATSSRLTRDRADVDAAANTVAGASGGSRIFARGQVPKA